MKIFFFFISFFFIINNTVLAQENNPCEFIYDISTKKCSSDVSNKDKFVSFDWDFSKIDFSKNKVEVEIIPILDCFNAINALNLKEVYYLIDGNNKFSSKGSYTLRHIDLAAKCFKWRVKITYSSCEFISDWNFYSFF
jgi:hypothetical protein